MCRALAPYTLTRDPLSRMCSIQSSYTAGMRLCVSRNAWSRSCLAGSWHHITAPGMLQANADMSHMSQDDTSIRSAPAVIPAFPVKLLLVMVTVLLLISTAPCTPTIEESTMFSCKQMKNVCCVLQDWQEYELTEGLHLLCLAYASTCNIIRATHVADQPFTKVMRPQKHANSAVIHAYSHHITHHK